MHKTPAQTARANGAKIVKKLGAIKEFKIKTKKNILPKGFKYFSISIFNNNFIINLQTF